MTSCRREQNVGGFESIFSDVIKCGNCGYAMRAGSANRRKRFTDMAVNDERAVRAIEKWLTETDKSRSKALEKEQRKLNKRLSIEE